MHQARGERGRDGEGGREVEREGERGGKERESVSSGADAGINQPPAGARLSKFDTLASLHCLALSGFLAV